MLRARATALENVNAAGGRTRRAAPTRAACSLTSWAAMLVPASSLASADGKFITKAGTNKTVVRSKGTMRDATFTVTNAKLNASGDSDSSRR